MSKQITINGKIFEPSGHLARQFGYSLDYISRLAREGKIEATRVGRQWFVEATSLKNFAEETTQKKIEAREQLRADRKVEHQEYVKQVQADTSTQSELPVHKPAMLASDLLLENASGRSVYKTATDVASTFVGTTLVVVAGLLGGIAINPAGFLSLVSEPVSLPQSSVSFETAQRSAAGAVTSFREEQPASVKDVLETGAANTGIVVFDELQSEATLNQVRAAFSDEVTVTFDSDDSGIITPVFKEQTGDDYQFLLVPIEEDPS